MSQIVLPNCLYISNTFGVSMDYIRFIFERDYCVVDNVVLFAKIDREGKPYTSARIHIGKIYDTIIATNFVNRLLQSNHARVIYKDEYYWNVMPNKTSTERRVRLDLSPVNTEKQEQNKNGMLSNSDFAAMVNEINDVDDIEFKNACRRLLTDDDSDEDDVIPTTKLVSDDYAVTLEKVVADLESVIAAQDAIIAQQSLEIKALNNIVRMNCCN